MHFSAAPAWLRGRCADNIEFKRRILGALGLLVASKVLTVQVRCVRCGGAQQRTCERQPGCCRVCCRAPGCRPTLRCNRGRCPCRHACTCLALRQVPFFFKHAVDALSLDPSGSTTAAYFGMFHLAPVALLLGYGISRCAPVCACTGCASVGECEMRASLRAAAT
jgi:hypothetical protein